MYIGSTFTNFYLNLLLILCAIDINTLDGERTISLFYCDDNIKVIPKPTESNIIKDDIIENKNGYNRIDNNCAYNPLSCIVNITSDTFELLQETNLLEYINNIQSNIDNKYTYIMETINKLQLIAQHNIKKYMVTYITSLDAEYDIVNHIRAINLDNLNNINDEEYYYIVNNDGISYAIIDYNHLFIMMYRCVINNLCDYVRFLVKLSESNIPELKYLYDFPERYEKLLSVDKSQLDDYIAKTYKNDKYSLTENIVYSIPNSIYNIIYNIGELIHRYNFPALLLPIEDCELLKTMDKIDMRERIAIHVHESERDGFKYSFENFSLFSSYDPSSLLYESVDNINPLFKNYSAYIAQSSPFLGSMQNVTGGLYYGSSLQYLSTIWMRPLFNNETLLTGVNQKHLTPLMIPSNRFYDAYENQYETHFENNLTGSTTFNDKCKNSMIPFNESYDFHINKGTSTPRFLAEKYTKEFNSLDFTYYVTSLRSNVLMRLILVGVTNWLYDVLMTNHPYIFTVKTLKVMKKVKSGKNVFKKYFESLNPYAYMYYNDKMPLLNTKSDHLLHLLIPKNLNPTIKFNQKRLKHTFYIFMLDSLKMNTQTLSVIMNYPLLGR